MAEIDRSLIGAASAPYPIEVEKGAIRRFAEAIGDPNPVYRDTDAARAQGYPGIIAPPTFAATFRPPEEPVWTRELDRRRVLAGEQGFRLERVVVAGDVLTCRIHFVGVDDKHGRSGPMELLHQEIRAVDPDGLLVVTYRRTMVYRTPRAGD